jgi:hypothetical protein
MEKSNEPPGIEPTTFRFVAQYLNHCATISSPRPLSVPILIAHFFTCIEQFWDIKHVGRRSDRHARPVRYGCMGYTLGTHKNVMSADIIVAISLLSVPLFNSQQCTFRFRVSRDP